MNMACPPSSSSPPLPGDLSHCQPTTSGDVDRTVDSSSSSSFPAASEFNFCVSAETQHHISSTADELFSNGKILPLSFPPTPSPGPPAPRPVRASPRPRPPPSPPPVTPAVRLKEIIAAPHEEEEEDESNREKKHSPFWRFGRSVSLNSGGRQKGAAAAGSGGGLMQSLQILSRSKSTGSNPNPNPKFQRQPSARSNSNKFLRRNSSLSSSSSSYYYSSCDNCRSGGVRISPVLNVPPPYLLPKGSGGGLGFSGFGILLCSGKEKEEDKSSRKKSTFSF